MCSSSRVKLKAWDLDSVPLLPDSEPNTSNFEDGEPGASTRLLLATRLAMHIGRILGALPRCNSQRLSDNTRLQDKCAPLLPSAPTQALSTQVPGFAWAQSSLHLESTTAALNKTVSRTSASLARKESELNEFLDEHRRTMRLVEKQKRMLESFQQEIAECDARIGTLEAELQLAHKEIVNIGDKSIKSIV
ncbi:hypothetical protein CYLTODRAFT_415674 [Cylindrobasidium torrendii FP15055 ss-10]|uniref:Uncharacterized protein n=1 Tax=Cylindrobasidium torrendii FP15055 ss-10 TaxID=1314674 RepID=A0A0D7ARW1_9AGAR|nr:hypothetical protein CYLTODRAFT_415674 [Cylindrobasidium torrendii FP15055 ss-10]